MADNGTDSLNSSILRVEREMALKEAELRQLKLKLAFLKDKLDESQNNQTS